MWLLTLTLAVVAAQSPSDRAKAMLAKMTLDEKITMLHGSIGAYVVRSCRRLVSVRLAAVTGMLCRYAG
jgi:hypothetical protein